MGDTVKKVQPIDPLRVPAAAYNLFVDARDFQRHAHGLGQGSMPSFRQPTVVPVRNNTGADGSRFHGVGLQAGGVTDRMADGIDKIERNTRPLRDAEGIAFE